MICICCRWQVLVDVKFAIMNPLQVPSMSKLQLKSCCEIPALFRCKPKLYDVEAHRGAEEMPVDLVDVARTGNSCGLQLVRRALGVLLLSSRSKQDSRELLETSDETAECLERYARFCHKYKGAVGLSIPWSNFRDDAAVKKLKSAVNSLSKDDMSVWQTAPDWVRSSVESDCPV
jgi:hypothetical protein